MTRKIVTLYIDDTSIRLMVTHGNRIKKWADLPLDSGLAKMDVAIKETEIAAQIKQLLKTRKIRTKKVIVGVSGLHCLTRPITLPQLPGAMLAEAVMREARRVLPVPLEQLYISWQTVPATQGKIQVFLVATPRNTADTLLKMLRRVGLKPHLMDVKPLALARIVKQSTAVIVDVQSTEFDIVIMADGVPQPIRTIPFPNEELSLQEKLPRIREDVDRTIEFYNSNNPEKPIASDVPIFVSGELANEPELHKSLSDEFGCPVLPLSSPLKCPEQLDLTRYMVNVGLALKELSSGKESGPLVTNLNTLPAPYRPKPFPFVKVMAIPATALVIGLLALLAGLVQDASADLMSMRNQLDRTNMLTKQKQLQKKDLTENIAELEKKLAAAKASRDTFTAALHSLDKQGNTANGDLRVTTDSLLSPISLNGFSHNNDKLTIRGQSPSEVEILSYAGSLDASGRFSEIIVASIKRIEEGGGMDFTLILKPKGEG